MSDNVPPSGLGWGAPENLPPKSDPDKARVRRYAEAMDPDAFDDGKPKSTRTVAVLQWSVRRKIATDHARAFIAVADEEQAELRADLAETRQRLAAVEALADGPTGDCYGVECIWPDDLRAVLAEEPDHG